MNLSAIKALTGAGKYCTVLNSADGQQWISEGHAAWLVEDVRIENEATIASLFNLTDAQVDKARIIIKDTDSLTFTRAGGMDEKELEEAGEMVDAGKVLLCLMSDRGALWVDTDLLKPLRKDYRRYYVRWKEGDDPVIAVYDDLLACKALVLPLNSVGAEGMREKARKLCAPVAEWKVERPEVKNLSGGADEGGQERAPEQIEISELEGVDG